MAKLKTKDVKKITSILDELIKEYKEKTEHTKRDYRTYEERLQHRLRGAFRGLKPLVKEAIDSLTIIKSETRGAKPILSLEQKVLALLLKHLIGKSNRDMSLMIVLFSWLTDIDVSYKTIERLYSDEEVILVLYNMHKLMLKKKGIKNADSSGDGTGYGLTISKHYASEAQKLKDKIKKVNGQSKKSKKPQKAKKALFVYSFAIIDIKTKMYLSYGTSFKSEKEAYDKSIEMLKEVVKDTNICIESIRLDRYFQQKYVKDLEEQIGKIKFYIIPKKSATIKGSSEWKKMLKAFVKDIHSFLKEYFKRNQSESGFSEDKKRIGWKLGQKRPDRINTANILTGTWHNLYWYTS